ncbi:hypothetical protein [Demequina sp. NBRC 110054]|uniref:prealbumin-like fold domain-containing protein n=1 Tax=Demequina sp. NBRC 110054 TaxID=1570343 RepID=UPI001177376A|nr:hypothetical protein [Demequina sp. NBRC 110054]
MKRRRPGAAALTVTALVAAMGTVAVATPAVAAAVALDPVTGFEIDGNTVLNSGKGDWDAFYGAGTTPGGLPTTGIYASSTTPSTGDGSELCRIDPGFDNTDDIAKPGSSLHDGPNWPVVYSKVNGKTDLRSMSIAAEKVDVGGGEIDDIIYVSYERCDALDDNELSSGSMISTLYIDNGDGVKPSDNAPNAGAGDLLLAFYFNPSDQNGATAEVLEYNGSAWINQGSISTGAVSMWAGQTFSEAAVNLTQVRKDLEGNDYDPGVCGTYSVGGTSATVPGYSLSSTIKDIVYAPPITISDCGTLDVTKTANVDDDTTSFDYKIKRLSGKNVVAGEDRVYGDLMIDETDTYPTTGTLPYLASGTDYVVKELTENLDPGWSLDSIVCTYNNIFAPGHPLVEVTLYPVDGELKATRSSEGSKTDASFLVAPGANASCVIHNVFTGVTVNKVADGDEDAEFVFKYSVNGGQWKYKTIKGGESFSISVDAGDKLVVKEKELPTDGLSWTLTDLSCTGPQGGSVGTVGDDGSITIDKIATGATECTFWNEQAGKLIVKKATEGGTGTFTFGGTIAQYYEDPSITTTADDGTPSGGSLKHEVKAAESGFSVTEEPAEGWSGDITCTSDMGEGEIDPADFGIAAGETVTCLAYNVKLGRVSLTKTVEGIDDDLDWEFGFTLLPEATGGGTQTVSGTGDTVDAGPLTWTDLVPGETYVLTEVDGTDTDVDDFDVAWKCYDTSGQEPAELQDANGDEAGFGIEVTPGMVVECDVTNTAKASSVQVTKTVEDIADGLEWSFTFSITPGATGENPQYATGTGPGTDVVSWDDLIPGETYTIAEGTYSEYKQTFECTGLEKEQIVESGNTYITFVAGFDQEITCDATNTAKTTDISVTKTVEGVADDYVWSFDFTLDPPGGEEGTKTATNAVEDGETVSWTGLLPGQEYTIVEEVDGDYDQEFACYYVDGQEPVLVEDINLDKDGVQFVAGFGETIECDATNTAKPSSLEVTKNVFGVGDTEEWGFDFTLTPDGGAAVTKEATGTGAPESDTVEFDLIPGETYTIAEEIDGRFDQEFSCTGIPAEDVIESGDTWVTFVAGFDQSIECTADNTAKQTDVSVYKKVEGVADGFDWSFNFALFEGPSLIAGPTSISGAGSTTEGPIDWEDLKPGNTYTIVEEVADGYTTDLVCMYVGSDDEFVDSNPLTNAVTFVAGYDQEIECTATNTAKTTTVELTKQVEGVADGFPWSFGFILSPATADGGLQTAEGTGATTDELTWTGLIPGQQYMISEVANDDYEQTLKCNVVDIDQLTPQDARSLVPTGPMVTFVAGLDQTIECTAVNTAKPSKVTLTKTVSGVDDDFEWSFTFGLDPAANPAGDQTASGMGNTSADPIVWTDLIPGETYTISEDEFDGYDSLVSCEGVLEEGDDDPLSVTFVAGVNEEIVCKAENAADASELTLTKSVDGVADGFEWEFDFELTVPPSEDGVERTISGSGSTTSDPVTWEGLIPGTTYTVSEIPEDGYTTELTCTLDDEPVVDQDQVLDGSVTFTAGVDQTIVCEAVNTAIPSEVSLTKTVEGVADGFEWEFGFSLYSEDYNSGFETISGSGSTTEGPIVWTDLTPGETYTVVELEQDGYTTELTCMVGDEPVTDLDETLDHMVTFEAGLAQEIVCEAVNTATPTDLTLTKTVEGVADGFEWSFDFAIDPDDEEVGTQTIDGMGSTTSDPIEWMNLVPGAEYTVSEAPVDGYTTELTCMVGDEPLTDLDETLDNMVTFEAGLAEEIVCSAVNTATPTEVTLTKSVEGVADGFAWEFEFLLVEDPMDTGVQTASGSGSGEATSDPIEWEGLVPGETYSILEQEVEGYASDITCMVGDDEVVDLDQDGNVFTFVAGLAEEIVCSAVNTAVPAEVSLTKTVEGVADGFEWSFDFAIDPDDEEVGTQTIDGMGSTTSDPITWESLVPGAEYTVSETPVDGYTTELTCMVGDEPLVDMDETLDNSFTFMAGLAEEIVCEAVNVAAPSNVTLTKTVEGVADGLEWSFDFTLDGVEEEPEPEPEESTSEPAVAAAFELLVVEPVPVATVGDTQTVSGMGSGDADPISWMGLIPGETYTVSETPVDGYDTELMCWITDEVGVLQVPDLDDDPASVTFVAGLAQDITCSATNTAAASSLSLEKTVLLVAADVEWSFDFTLDPDDNEVGTQTVSGTGPGTADAIYWTDLVPGETYVVAETPVNGYNTAMVCEIVGDEENTAIEDMDDVATTFTFVAGFDQDIACRVANVLQQDTGVEGEETATLKVTKTVEGVDDDTDWSFDFTLDPDPEDLGARTASGTGSTSADTLTWRALVPGTTYTLTEEEVDGYVTDMVCTGADDEDDVDNTFTFTAEDGVTVECEVTNKAQQGGQLSGGDLASTGADPWWALGLLALLTGGGATLLLIRRRYVH